MFKWLGSHSAFRFFLAGGGAPCVSLDLLRPKSRTFQPKLSCSAFGTASQCQRVIVGIASFRSQNDLGKNQSRNPSYFFCRLPVTLRTLGAMSPHLFLFWWAASAMNAKHIKCPTSQHCWTHHSKTAWTRKKCSVHFWKVPFLFYQKTTSTWQI